MMLNFKHKKLLYSLYLLILITIVSGCSRDPLGSYDENGKPNKINFMLGKCLLMHPRDGHLPSCNRDEIFRANAPIDRMQWSEFGINTMVDNSFAEVYNAYVQRGTFGRFFRKEYTVKYSINANGNVVAFFKDSSSKFSGQIEFSKRADGYYGRPLPLDCTESEEKMKNCEKQVEGPDAGFFKISVVNNSVR